MEPKEQELAGMAMQFMARVQLSGQEVPAFQSVMVWLEQQRAGAPSERPAA